MGFIADEIIAKAEEPSIDRAATQTYVSVPPSWETSDEKIDKITAHIQAMRGCTLNSPDLRGCAPGGLASQAANNMTMVQSQIAPYLPSTVSGWQALTCSPMLAEQTDRLRIDGGWLYRTKVGGSIALAFVPEPR